LRNKAIAIAELHDAIGPQSAAFLEAVTCPSYPRKRIPELDVAIVGMACIYPQSPGLESYWKSIINAENLLTEVPDERWNKDVYYDPTVKTGRREKAGKKSNTKWGGFIPDVYFDPLEYGIPPQSLAAIDPVQLLSLEVAERALDNAGYKERDFDRENTMVVFGAEAGTDLAGAYGFRNLYPQFLGEIPKELDDILPELTEDSFPGILGNVIAGRISNRLDLGGMNCTVDAACASSLAAIEVGCKELLSGSSGMVLAGGADLHNGINDYLMFSSLHTLADGQNSRPFDADTDGQVTASRNAADCGPMASCSSAMAMALFLKLATWPIMYRPSLSWSSLLTFFNPFSVHRRPFAAT